MYLTTNITKIFNTNNITDLKYNQLYSYAVLLRDYKNKISKEVFENIDFYMDTNNIKNKYAFVSYMRKLYPQVINCYYDGPSYEQIYNNYKVRQESIIKQLEFKKKEFIKFDLYKRDCKNGKKGELKQVVYKYHITDLSICLTYFAKCDKPLNLNKLIEKLKDPELTLKVREKYIAILRLVNKFGYEKLWNLAQSKRHRILSYYNKPIEYKSLTFDGEVQKSYFIKRNKNHDSIISGFATFILPDYNKEIITKTGKIKHVDTIDIPIKISSVYHGSRSYYIKSPNKSGKCSYKFKILFDEYNKDISIQYCLTEQEKQIPDNKTNYVGIDVNIKHNLFSISDGSVYDYDRKLISEYLNELNKIDELKKQAKKQHKLYIISKKKQHKLNIYKRVIKHSNERIISDMCKDLVVKNIDHIILENLDNKFNKSYAKNDEFREKYNRIGKILNLGLLKEMIKSISCKYGIQVSFVQSEYTSQLCSVCGCIHSENRLNQEKFYCIECGHNDNADHNAAVNIKNRVTEAVLCTSLLNKLPDGSYQPKSIKHNKIKEVIQRGVIQLLQLKL